MKKREEDGGIEREDKGREGEKDSEKPTGRIRAPEINGRTARNCTRSFALTAARQSPIYSSAVTHIKDSRLRPNVSSKGSPESPAPHTLRRYAIRRFTSQSEPSNLSTRSYMSSPGQSALHATSIHGSAPIPRPSLPMTNPRPYNDNHITECEGSKRSRSLPELAPRQPPPLPTAILNGNPWSYKLRSLHGLPTAPHSQLESSTTNMPHGADPFGIFSFNICS